MAVSVVQSSLPLLDSKSEPPALFDGTTRLYINEKCPFAQRVWIAKNFKGLDDIKLVNIDLHDKPAWFLEKVYPRGQVPALEHNGKVTGESLDLLKYLEEEVGGRPIWPVDESKKETAQELLDYASTFVQAGFSALRNKDSNPTEDFGAVLDHVEAALGKYDGPFFLGEFGVVDATYIPFIERFQLTFQAFRNYDITAGRPNITKFIEAVNQVEAYTKTKQDPQELVQTYKRLLKL
ncbi:hypothetical protein O6H91_15G030200 [Diphasiastrum complanatum]|uniref:Uncharacterized protein n=1 Tax=Diphasiastrum complanatum TaxID=34168 RepID=A0ACC2BH00_DIPCM|nr:hypothetical protein O6H91_15G030200 [Diphasiastrum complanatum]